MITAHTSRPWIWVPTLYLAEGIPFFVVNILSIALLKDLHVSNTLIGVVTSLITIPWIINPLWSPFVDVMQTKRWWILWMQILMCITVGLLAWIAPIGYVTGALILFTITAFASATHDIAADGYYMLALTDKQQANFIGIRSTFYKLAQIFCQSFILIVIGWLENPQLPAFLQSVNSLNRLVIMLQNHASLIVAWRIGLLLIAAILTLIAISHLFTLPQIEQEKTESATQDILDQIQNTLVSFFTKPGIWLAISFMLLYRLPEALVLKMELPFLQDPTTIGGLGQSKAAIGSLNFIAIGLMLLGGILGGFIAGKKGLKQVMLWMCLMLTIPSGVYCYMAMVQPTAFWKIAVCIAFEQFGYGLGYTACMLYMIHIAEGKFQTAHFSLCTAFMFLGMFLPGLFSGWIADAAGYIGFFWIVMFCCIPSIAITRIVQLKL